MPVELDDLEHHLDLANKVWFGDLPPGAKGEALEQIGRIRNKLGALESSAIVAFEATQEHRAEGHSTSVGWLQHHEHLRERDATGRRRLAHDRRGMPLVEEAQVAGLITAEHVTVLADARRKVGDDAFALAEEALVDAAVSERFADFARTVRYFVMRARPRDAVEQERLAYENRWASSSRTIDGNGKVDAWIEPVGFAAWQAELDRLCDHLLEQDRAEARDRLGREPTAGELRRTARQRRADAMVLMAQRSAAYDGDDPGPSSFTLIVHADADLIQKLIAAILDDDAGPDDIDDLELGPDSLHELDDGTVVTVNTVLLALLTGTVKGILYDPDGEILRYGRGRRLFSRPQAEALRAKFRTCQHPFGCDRTGPRLQTDHVREHEDGGPTDTGNGQPLCGPHNRWKHNTKRRPPPPMSSEPPDGPSTDDYLR